MNLSNESTNNLLFLGFNQDSGFFACGMTNGFVIYNVDPFRETFKRVFPNGGIGIVEMLFRCNLIALVGGGRNPRYPTNKVMIWDDHQNKCIGELMFRSQVLAVKLRRDRVVVVLNTKVYIYRFSDLKLLDQIVTLANPKGLVSLCPDTLNNILAVPGLVRGSIRVEFYDISKATLIKAHDSDLAQFTLNIDGSRLASASEKGTLIRLWDCHTGEPLREFRRGMDRAEIYYIAFNHQTTFLACSSDKGTIHIFALNDNLHNDETIHDSDEIVNSNFRQSSYDASSMNSPNKNETMVQRSNSSVPEQTSNKSFNLFFLRSLLPSAIIPKYINSEWSYAQVRGIESRAICAFDRNEMKVIIVSVDGYFHLASFEQGGECNILSSSSFLVKPNDENINIVVNKT